MNFKNIATGSFKSSSLDNISKGYFSKPINIMAEFKAASMFDVGGWNVVITGGGALRYSSTKKTN